MKLYELSNHCRTMKEAFLKGELDEEDFELDRELILEEFKNKSSSLIHVNNEFENDIEAISKEIKRLTELKLKIKTAHNKYKKYIVKNMEQMDIKKVETPLGILSLRKSYITEVSEELPNKFFDVVQSLKRHSITDLKKEMTEEEKEKYLTVISKNNLQIK